MSEQPLTPLAGLALADALWNADLVPHNTERHGWHDTMQYTYGRPASQLWRPWESLDAVAHLLERYGISLCYSYRRWFVYCERCNVLEDEPVVSFAALPAAVARLALRLHATEKEESP